MCGIAGLVGGRAAREAPRVAEQFLRILCHRGPDDHGWLTSSRRGVQLGRGRPAGADAEVILLQRRLSILDLSEAGWQPMGTADGRHYLVFNGEIYNYVELRRTAARLGYTFRSDSDTEVLLYALAHWGKAALTRLVGMFAFACLDTQARRLLLARDFFGIKPLYYTWAQGAFAFASEIKALLELPGVKRRVHPERLFEYVRHGLTDHGGATLFADIQQLPAAHYLEIDLDRPAVVAPVRYWRIDLSQRVELSFEEAAGRLRDLFLDNVRLHLRSDVPVGAALSGGIDSSAIVAAMRHLEPKLEIHAFSYVAEDPSINEERWVDLVGQSTGAVLHKTRPTPEELVADLDTLVYTQDEPFGSTSIYAQHRVFRLAREAGIKVMLDGQGADEMLAGYRSYLTARLASLLVQGKWSRACRFARRAARLPGSGGWRGLLRVGGLLLPPACKRFVLGWLGEDLVPDWLNGSWFVAQGVTPRPIPRNRVRDMLRAQLKQTLVETSLPMLLRYEDRNSMAFSIESRVPFLTPALVSFVLNLPEEYVLADDGTSKHIFRRAMRGIVPDAILERKDKIGFATPEQQWLAVLRPWVEQVLASEAARQNPVLKWQALEREWQAVLQGRKRFDFRVWRWLNLIRWTERFSVSFGE